MITFVVLCGTSVLAMYKQEDSSESESLLHDVVLDDGVINFCDQDFMSGESLCLAIDRELDCSQEKDEQQEDIHKVSASIARALKNAIERSQKRLSNIVDTRGYRGMSSLSWAAAKGRIDIVRVLLSYPDKAEVQELLMKPWREGYIPLHYAAIEGQIGIAHLMLLACNNPYSLLTCATNQDFMPEFYAYKWCKYKTASFLQSAKKTYLQGGEQALRGFLENYEPEISQESACGCCSIF